MTLEELQRLASAMSDGRVTRADFAELRRVLETQMLALLGEVRKLEGQLRASRREWLLDELDRHRAKPKRRPLKPPRPKRHGGGA